jgi:CubicO group peptidase (beta-lactamase class C family)
MIVEGDILSERPGSSRQAVPMGTYTRALFVALLTCTHCCGEGREDKADRIDALVRQYQRCGYFNGAVLVAEHGRVIYVKGVGEANMELHAPNTADTLFDIASITKQFTGVLVLQQGAQGTLSLNGTVSEYLPWYRKDTGGQMTIDQLLHHTAGLPPDYDNPQFSDSPEAAVHYTPQAFAEKFCQPDLTAKPGTQWAYSNRGYILLGLILERVTAKSFDDLLHQQLLVPLGMKSTGIDRNNLAEIGGAVGYMRHAGPRYTTGPYLDRQRIFAAGALYSTVKDLYLWNQALSSSAFLSDDVRAQIFKPGMNNWACGWFVTKIPKEMPGGGSTLAEMRGDMPGNFFAHILRYPEQDSVIIVLRNTYGSSENFEGQLQTLLFDGQATMPSRSIKDVAAHAWQTSYAFLGDHLLGSISVVILAIVAYWYSRACRKSSIKVS